MKNKIIIILLFFTTSCAKRVTDGNQIVKSVHGSYVKFYKLNRLYYINKADIKKGDTLYMKIKKP